MGIDKESIPYGATFTSFKNDDAKIIDFAYALEQETKLRKAPTLAGIGK